MRKAFTLIELLVVIAIIAILAAILFPVFAQAKQAAKKSADLSNQKQVGLAFVMYASDNDDIYPTAYFHRAWEAPLGGTRAGYIHWSALVASYVKNLDLYVSPGDKLRGHAPTCFASGNNNGGKGFPGGQQPDRCPAGDPRVPADKIINGFIVDDQVPRLSYTVNSAVIPRLRNSADLAAGVRTVSQTAVDNVANTIITAGLVDDLPCLNGQSLGTGLRNSSHRSTNAATVNQANTAPYFGENTDASVSPLWALNYNQITTGGNNVFELCKQGIANMPLITYHSARRWGNGDNYGMADGSAKFRNFSATVRPDSYMWGARMYTAAGQPLLDPVSGNPVVN